MKVILKEKIINLGSIGDSVEVKSGYARNYLIPQGKALPFNAENMKQFAEIKAKLEATEKAKLKEAKNRLKQVESLEVEFLRKVKENEVIFGSVNVSDIVDFYAEKDIVIDRSEVKIIEGPFKAIGEHSFILQFHADLSLERKCIIKSDQASADTEIPLDSDDLHEIEAKENTVEDKVDEIEDSTEDKSQTDTE